jgi:hypothetical protein
MENSLEISLGKKTFLIHLGLVIMLFLLIFFCYLGYYIMIPIYGNVQILSVNGKITLIADRKLRSSIKQDKVIPLTLENNKNAIFKIGTLNDTLNNGRLFYVLIPVQLAPSDEIFMAQKGVTNSNLLLRYEPLYALIKHFNWNGDN